MINRIHLSIEAPEARILAQQLQGKAAGKTIARHALSDYTRLNKIGMIKDPETFSKLDGETITMVQSRGNTILFTLTGDVFLVVGPEYGGTVILHNHPSPEESYHLLLVFTDGTSFTVRLKSMGVIGAYRGGELESSYIYARDFHGKLDPLDPLLSGDEFKSQVTGQNKMLKSLLVGKNAVVVGVSNSAFMDIAYTARVHPKRKGSSLTPEEAERLLEALHTVMLGRLELGGKNGFTDLYGDVGGYMPVMSSHMKGGSCERCGAKVEGQHIAGGITYFCPGCQR